MPRKSNLVRAMVADALARGIVPPFTIKTASGNGTLHKIEVSANGDATHTVEYDAFDEIERLGLALDETIVEKEESNH